jgi:hypothetical protein
MSIQASTGVESPCTGPTEELRRPAMVEELWRPAMVEKLRRLANPQRTYCRPFWGGARALRGPAPRRPPQVPPQVQGPAWLVEGRPWRVACRSGGTAKGPLYSGQSGLLAYLLLRRRRHRHPLGTMQRPKMQGWKNQALLADEGDTVAAHLGRGRRFVLPVQASMST